MKHSWTNNAFWDENNMIWRKWCKFVSFFSFNNTYGLPVLTMNTKFQIKNFMLVWSIYRSFVLNWAWNVSLQIMIFLYVFSAWVKVELNTRFETWITWNGVKCVSSFHLSYLITLRFTCDHNGHQTWKSTILCLMGRSTDYLS
jgi:hypothetical protein